MAEEPATGQQPRSRKLLGFYIATFVLLGLVMAGVFLYQPLKLRWAIYRVRQGKVFSDWHLDACHRAALKGHRTAMDVCLGVYGRKVPLLHRPAHLTECVNLAIAEPEAFTEVLAGRSAGEVHRILTQLEASLLHRDKGRSGSSARSYYHKDGMDAEDAGGLLGQFEMISLNARRPEIRRIAEAVMGFIHRRFAGELAEAEKKEAGKPRTLGPVPAAPDQVRRKKNETQ